MATGGADRDGIRFRLLGSFEVTAEKQPVAVPGAAERALLALLLLAPGLIVPATSLIDRLWAEGNLPADPVNALQLRVSKLRRALASSGSAPIQRDGVGYRLDVDPLAIDAEVFERQVRQVRSDVAAATAPGPEHLQQYDDALALWRGEALADFVSEPWAVAESVRLEELRRAARAERARLSLALGRHADVITDLEPLVAADPTHESMAGLLMVALYREGRQADALEVFARTRTLLDDELGLEPSASLRSLHERVLRQDESLGATGEEVTPLASASPVPTRRRDHPTAPSNLPTSLPALIGRGEELAALETMFGEARLVTLVGPGGAGKTTLGLHLAAGLRVSFPDGVFLVRLAPLRESAQLVTVVGEALGIPQDAAAAGLDEHQRMADYLVGKRLLLVIDNCEHLIDAVATFVDGVLARTEDLVVVATSREALAVPGEVQFPVGPLSAPPESAAAEDVAASPAVRLMVGRIGATRPGFAPSAADLAALARICRALDGMPLALELASARAVSMSLTEVADRLDQRFALLTSGPRTAEERQRTLRATVDWSYDLLSVLERRVFDRLAVFQGGWSLRAAEAVVTDRETDTGQVLHAMGRLVEQSLVTTEPGEVTRYRMLETLREYAADRLEETGETDELRRRHARFFGSLAEEAAAGLRGHDQRRTARLLRPEHANLRAAITWLSGPAGNLDDALRLAGSLGLFWHQGRHVEGREILRRLLDRTEGSDEARALALQAVSLVERPKACIVHPDPRCAAAARESLATFSELGDAPAAALSQMLLAVEGVTGSEPAASHLLQEAQTQFRDRDDAWGLAVVGFIRMETALKAGEEADAVRLGRTTAAAFRELDDLWGLSAVLYHLGWGLRQFGRYTEAGRTLEEAIDVAAAAGVENTVQWALGDLGITHLHLGHEEAARDAFRRAGIASAAVGDHAGLVLAGYGHGLLAQMQDDWGTVLSLFSEAARGFEALRTPVMVGQALVGLARGHEGLGELRAAEDSYRHAAELGAHVGEPSLVALSREGLARLAAGRGDVAAAVELRDAAALAREQGHRPAPPLDRRDVERLSRMIAGDA